MLISPQLKTLAGHLGLETEFPYEYLDKLISKKAKVDYLVVISDMIIAPNKAHPAGAAILAKVQKLREFNPNLCFVCIDLFGSGSSFVGGAGDSPNDIYITGYSDAILKYIAARREVDAQLAHIEKTDAEIAAKKEKGKEKEDVKMEDA